MDPAAISSLSALLHIPLLRLRVRPSTLLSQAIMRRAKCHFITRDTGHAARRVAFGRLLLTGHRMLCLVPVAFRPGLTKFD
jgi:Na+/phosphate symporter